LILFISALSSSFIVLNSAPVASKSSCSQTWIPVTATLDQLKRQTHQITLIYQISLYQQPVRPSTLILLHFLLQNRICHPNHQDSFLRIPFLRIHLPSFSLLHPNYWLWGPTLIYILPPSLSFPGLPLPIATALLPAMARWSTAWRRGMVEHGAAMAEPAPSRTASVCTGAGRPGASPNRRRRILALPRRLRATAMASWVEGAVMARARAPDGVQGGGGAKERAERAHTARQGCGEAQRRARAACGSRADARAAGKVASMAARGGAASA
jgi:hypothetical protein